jgi:hypothetical protein
MRTQTTINGIELKTSKGGRKYKSYKTTDGSMSCFEDSICAELDKCNFCNVEIEIEERNGFKNITGFYSNLGQTAPSQAPQQHEATKTNEPLNPLNERDFRINIKQSSKGFAYFEVTAKSDDLNELESCLKAVLDIAKKSVEELNSNFNSSNVENGE